MGKKVKDKWFIRVRGSYLPNSWQGWLTYLPFVGYLIFTLVYGWSGSSLTRALLFIAANWFAAAVVMTYVARRTS